MGDPFSDFIGQQPRRDRDLWREEMQRLITAQAEAARVQIMEELFRRPGMTAGINAPATSVTAPAPAPLQHAGVVAGPILAWRVWKIRADGILLSVTRDVPWPTGAPLIASRDGSGLLGTMNARVASGSPGGIYAVKTRDMLASHAYGQDCLAGQVALWGKVIEHERGYRAEFAYPALVDLSVAPPMPGFPRPARRSALAQMIRDNYGCEVLE